MKESIKVIKSFKKVYPQIYAFELPNRKEYIGSQKIGYTERALVDDRIKEQVKTAAINEQYNKLWSSPAFFKDGEESFKDKAFHRFLEKNGIEKRTNLGSEWFYFNGKPFQSKELFDLFKTKCFSTLQDNKKIEYKLRDEQTQAVKKAYEYFQKNQNGEFLWNAKPRFGKTLASYALAKQLEAKSVLIVTNRPAIANSWLDDYEKFIDGYSFISENEQLKDRATITREQYLDEKIKKPFITFISLQDLKGSVYFGGHIEKLDWVADLTWSLLIIDESHEGVDTNKTNAAFDKIKRQHTLHLSGTPFKQLAREKFNSDAIYNWTYLDEQKVKQEELQYSEIGDHTELPDLNLFAYRISQMITKKVNKGVDINDENHDYAFDLNEFFSTKNQKFVYESNVKDFLKNLTTNKKYPFSTPELREELKHTFWFVGNRVDSVKALETLLKIDDIFKEYKIIVAAGNGRSFEEEVADVGENKSSFAKVEKAIKENDKTITLSCGQLTTGVTIKEWTAVLMLGDIKSASLYMQTAFRAQNPYKKIINGALYVKKSAYLFDFAPTRVLEIYDSFANGLIQDDTSKQETREKNIKELLNFFPVVSEDVNGEMVELNATQVLTFPNALLASEIVGARFMSNLLFNDTLKGVFNFPKEVEDILNKMPEEKNNRVQKAPKQINLDEVKISAENKVTTINENKKTILGDKIYKNIGKVVDDLQKNNIEQINSLKLTQEVVEIAEPLIVKYKEIYSAKETETKDLKLQIEKKVLEIAEEFNSVTIKDKEGLKESLINMIEYDFVENIVTQKEDAKDAQVRKTKEEEIRNRLRSFTRTIPMCIMANDTTDEITIDNFDSSVDDKDFLNLTSITKEEFHKLRDGFEYNENGESKYFEGVFNKYRFNASIAEFRHKKIQLADYFKVEGDIFEFIPNQKTNQVFTPKKVVQMMVNQLERHATSLFTRTDSTFIDLYMKSGMYITEIVKKLFNNTRNYYNSDKECLKHILENQVFGLAPTNILQAITQSYIFGCDKDKTISRRNFTQYDLTSDAKNGNAKEKLNELFGKNSNMKFDVVIGNPPYQENVGKTENQDTGNSNYIYYHFQNIADEIANQTCLIYPFGGWFDSPLSFKGFGKKILNDKHTKFINAYEGTIDKRAWYRCDKEPDPLFGKEANLSAGISIVFRDLNQTQKYFCYANRIYSDSSVNIDFECWDNLTPNPDFINWAKRFKGMKKLNSRIKNGVFGIESDFVEKNPTKVSLNKSDWGNPIQLLTNDKSGSSGRATMYWVDKNIIKKGMEYINLYKVITTSAYPKKTFVSGKPSIENVQMQVKKLIEILPKGSAFGRSRLSLFMSESENDCINFIKYTQTRFFAFLLLNEPNQRSTIGKVILDQDFTNQSDIDWDKSIIEIDLQLYEKYHLSKEEIKIINNHK